MDNSMMDVQVNVAVVGDGGGARSGAQTTFHFEGPTWPTVQVDRHGKIVGFNGRVTWHYTVTIQTRYVAGSGPETLSGYGRGTTADDRQNGDITLGFHERCHRSDYAAYLRDTPLPDLPELAVGMSAGKYRRATSDYRKRLRSYFKTMERQSKRSTDQVGYTLSKFRKTGRPYRHILPAN